MFSRKQNKTKRSEIWRENEKKKKANVEINEKGEEKKNIKTANVEDKHIRL